MSTVTRPPTIILPNTNYPVTFWQFIEMIAGSYLLAALCWILGPLGLLFSALLGYITSIIFAGGLLAFALQRPGFTLSYVWIAFAIHVVLWKYLGMNWGLLWGVFGPGAEIGAGRVEITGMGELVDVIVFLLAHFVVAVLIGGVTYLLLKVPKTFLAASVLGVVLLFALEPKGEIAVGTTYEQMMAAEAHKVATEK